MIPLEGHSPCNRRGSAAALIDADPALAKVGVLGVPRTVLRFVLLNFMVNAADAVRESGKSQLSLSHRRTAHLGDQ